ncbi:putative Mce family protein [Mycolicibacterium anyangense]|uniref:Putative Mce family protein n=1 Tax=Mycolicibacterium anyangense TaxID=1431246 RepID=A0A6N4W2B5_9MYCO|nr:putative Mce family protein [Mycolicibacterium anyangense]
MPVGLAATLTAGCSLDPTRMPVPGAYSPANPYRLKIEFSSALNLPARAKVDTGGIQVGVLDHVALDGSTAVAYVDVAGDTTLADNTRAELRQATPLGDVYIALLPPATPSSLTLRNGDTIPLRNTAPATNVEDVLRSVSNLMAGGAIGTLQTAVIDANRAFPKDPNELTHIQRTIGGILNDLAANQETMSGILLSLENISSTLSSNTAVFNRLVTEGPAKLGGLSAVTLGILNLVADSKDLGKLGGDVINPITGDVMQMLSYITPLVGTMATVDTTIPVIADKLNALVRDKLIPFFGKGGPRYTISELRPPAGSEGVDPADKADQAVSAMRTMGLLP